MSAGSRGLGARRRNHSLTRRRRRLRTTADFTVLFDTMHASRVSFVSVFPTTKEKKGVLTLRPVRKRRLKSFCSRSRCTFFIDCYTPRRSRHFFRRRSRTRFPARDFMRSRNPWVFFLFRFDG